MIVRNGRFSADRGRSSRGCRWPGARRRAEPAAAGAQTRVRRTVPTPRRHGLKEGPGGHAQANAAHALQAHRRPAVRRERGRGLLGPGPSGVRGPGVPVGAQGVRGPVPRSGRHQAGVAGRVRRALLRAGAQAGARRDRPHQAGRGGGCGGARARVHRRRPRGTLHGGARGDELQRAHAGDLPGVSAQPHPAGAREQAGGDGGPGGRGGAALRAARHAARGQPGAGGAVEDVRGGGGLGARAAGRQPVPFRGAVPAGDARAVPERGRVPAGGPRAARAGGPERAQGAGGGRRCGC